MRRILVVEDEPAIRDAFQMVLSSEAYIIDVAPHGEAALQLCREYTYDLILLDLMMPVLDGVGFLERFIDSDDYAPAKVIVLSNVSTGDNLTRALELGADKNVLKSSLSPRQLLATVRYELEV